MNRPQQIITRCLWAGLVLVMVGVVVGQFWMPRQIAPPLPLYYNVAPFHLIDENGRDFSDQDLRGRPYIADLIFTSCASTCPIMSAKMAQVQKSTPSAVQLVSFSVNPEFDTPAVLKDYGRRYAADESRWHFLTGSPKQMTDVAAALKLPGQGPLAHSDRLLLIDGNGVVRGIYDGTDGDAIKRLTTDATALAKRGGAA